MSKQQAGRQLHALLIIAILVAVVAPLVPLLIWSFAHQWFFPSVLPSAWSGRGWVYLFSSGSQLGKALLNSTVVAVSVTLLSVLVGLPAGRVLALEQFRGKTAVFFLILAPTIMPTIAVAMGIHVAFLRLRLTDTLLGVILVHLIPVLPYTVLILRSVFATYNPDYEGQARTLGARPWQLFWYITLPAIWPGVVVGSLFAFLISWSQYLLTLLIGGGQLITLPILLFAFANSGDYTVTAALSLIFVAPALLLFLFTARYLTGRHVALGGLGTL